MWDIFGRWILDIKMMKKVHEVITINEFVLNKARWRKSENA